MKNHIIKIMDDITNYTFRSVFDSVQGILEKGNWRDNIYVIIHSTGGDLEATLAIIDLFEAIPNKVYTVNMGRAESSAGDIFIIGEKRYMAKNAKFMFHSPATLFKEDSAFPTIALEGKAQYLRQLSDKLEHSLKEKTKIPHELISKGINSPTGLTFFADDCLKYGIADEIITDITKVLY